MYKIAVCDDNPADADYVSDAIKKSAQARAVMVEIEQFPSAEAFWFQYEDNQCYDMLFLDIEMKPDGMNGVELAAKLRKNDHAIQIVFVTGYMEYIADGYDVEALHYLLKPVTEAKIGSVLERAMQRLKDREKALFLQTADGSMRVLISEIRYLEVRRNYVTIHAEEAYTVKRTLHELEQELDACFFRTGRLYIVNLRYVRKITKSQVVLKDGAQVPLSRGLYDEIMSEGKRALDVRLYRQDIFFEQIDSIQDSYGTKSKAARYARGKAGLACAASTAVSKIFTGLIYLFVCLKAWGGAFGVGSVTQYVGAVTALSRGLAKVLEIVGEAGVNAFYLEREFSFLDIPNQMYQGSLTVEKRADQHYEVEFRNVSFCYPNTDDFALKNISLKFKVGERLAIVGQNGSGKTTFIKLLCRLYEPTEGQILLNGIEISKYDYQEYMHIFSVVFQDFHLLAFPVGQNIAAGGVYDRDKVQSCCRKAGVWERVASMAEGMDTVLYKDLSDAGVEVSGGEAQKLAIARALYRDSAFLILDEPTAALDPLSEYEIYARLNEIVEDRTAVYISHRLSSCRFCDEILVFHKGCLVQQGSHDTLLAQKDGKYRELWDAQAQYYVADASCLSHSMPG